MEESEKLIRAYMDDWIDWKGEMRSAGDVYRFSLKLPDPDDLCTRYLGTSFMTWSHMHALDAPLHIGDTGYRWYTLPMCTNVAVTGVPDNVVINMVAQKYSVMTSTSMYPTPILYNFYFDPRERGDSRARRQYTYTAKIDANTISGTYICYTPMSTGTFTLRADAPLQPARL